MLQSSNQYLRPDYLAAPTALDTKSSPLALLAQTCSAIGADTTNPKLLAANIEKSTKSMKSCSDGRDKCSPVSSQSSSVSTGSAEHQQQQQHQQQHQQQQHQQQQQQQQQQQIKSSFKPYESNNNHVRDRLEAEAAAACNLATTNHSQSSHRVKTPKSNNGNSSSNNINNNNNNSSSSSNNSLNGRGGGGEQRCDSNQSASSQRGGESPQIVTSNGLRRTPTSALSSSNVACLDMAGRNSSPQRVSSKESAGTPTALASPSAATASRLQAASDAAFAAAKEANYVKALHAAAAAAGMTQNSSANSSAYYSTGGYPGSSGGGGMPYAMDLMTAKALMSPHQQMFQAAALNPYLNYARLKGIDPATAAAMMSPNICRDPYCTGCPSSPHFLNKAAGQPCQAGCPQCDAQAGKANGGNSGGGNSAAAAAISSYHAQLAALAAASQLPYVCSWIAGDAAYCGKRFGTSDELFQHLRTHTASMPDSVLSAAAAGGIPPNHPLFQRTYPTPPLSPLSARYHPYGKPSMLPPSLAPPGSMAGLSMQHHPALAQYFSPYSLYGPRLGSSHP